MMHSEMILYPPVEGITELRKEAMHWINAEYDCHYALENTLVTAGGKFVLFAAMQLTLNEGDEVLIPAPYWVSYPQIARLFKAVPVILPTEASRQWKLTPETLKKHLTSRSKILILNNPGNPTGNLYTKEELTALLEVAKQANLFVIADEVYSGMVYDGKKFCSCATLSEDVLVVQSCSKNFAMTGWRLGFGFGPEKVIRAMTALQSQSTTGPSIVSQWAALAALKNCHEINAEVRTVMHKRRDLFIDTFNTLFHASLEKPPAALYVFIPLSIFRKSMTSAELCTELMTKHNIACVPGSAFGQEGYLRMAFSEKEDVLREGLQALQGAIMT
jgi:aspartate/methionine/tyrosine aminotransferase